MLQLPEDRQISWIRKRVGRLSDLLTADPAHHNSLTAKDAFEELPAYAA